MRLCLLFLLLVISTAVQGQELFSNVHKITMEDGLSHYKVLSFYPEEEGMWIGTASGLDYYDGFTWKHWTQEDQQLHFGDVDYLQKDQEGWLWIFHCKELRSKSQLQKIDLMEPGSQQIQSFEERFGTQAPFEIASIRQFFEDEQQQLYFFANQQLWRYTPSASFQMVPLATGFEAIDRFPNGTFIGFLNQRLALVSAEGDYLLKTNYKLQEGRFDFQGDHKKFIVTQLDQWVVQFVLQADGSYQQKPLPDFLSGSISVVAYDKQREQFWIFKDPNVHLVSEEGKSLVQYPGWPSTSCYDVAGNLWLSTYGAHLLKIQEKKFKRYLYKDPKTTKSEEQFRCRGILEDQGYLYVNSYKGPQRIDLAKDQFSPFGPADRRFVILKDHQKNLWFAKRALYKVEATGRNIVQTIQYRQADKRIWSMFEDRDGTIWIGDKGISMVENGEIIPFEQYGEFTQLQMAHILSFYKDKNGIIWAVSTDGLYILDPQKGIIAGFGTYWTEKNFLPTDRFQHMHQDAEGIYWLATEDKGLIRWNKATGDWRIFDKTNGFLSNNIYAVYEDDFDCLWMSSFNGLIRLDKKREEVRVYNEEDGINGNEFNRISHYQSPNGRIYFGGQNGVTAFHPIDFLSPTAHRPDFQLKIKGVSIFGKHAYRDTLPNGRPINLENLRSDTRVINLEILGSDPFWASKVDIHYSLELFDKDRSTLQGTSKAYISADNHVELFGMQPGKYNLSIQAIRKNGKSIGQALLVPIHIQSPITQSPYFAISLLTLFGLLTWGFLKIRTTHLRKRKTELEQMVKERTSQILKDQQTIKSQAEMIAEMRDQLQQKDQIWLDKLEALIQKRLEDTNLDLPSIIEDLDIGRSQFFEKVKSLTNMTPNQYIQEIRLSKAKAILEAGEVRTVKEVAFAVGMRRPAYFSKLFKERFGILPSEYFRRHNN
ncbi:MAG: two-component regulator propeller domain-containing protein [Bacteroidota bacterium]